MRMQVWLAAVIVLAAFQVAIIAVPEPAYWFWYDTSSDIVELVLAAALCSAISYTSVSCKALSTGIVLWYLFCTISNFITDYVIMDNVIYSTLSSVFIIAAISITFSMRFLLHWRPNNIAITDGKFYEVISKPENLSQVLVAIYTGRGGAFGITDGIHLWHYSKGADCMVREYIGEGYMMGRMGKEICSAFDGGRTELDSMVDRKFTALHNCLELHDIARKWR